MKCATKAGLNRISGFGKIKTIRVSFLVSAETKILIQKAKDELFKEAAASEKSDSVGCTK